MASRKKTRRRRATPTPGPTPGPTPVPMPVPAPLPPRRDTARTNTLQALALCLLVAVSYFPATGAGFVWDDVVLTMARPIHDWGGLWQIWFEPRSLTDYEGHYWPLLYTTFWLEHKLWGLNPLGYHLVNLVLHAGVVLLLWRLLLRLGVAGAVGAATPILAAAVFAVHPLHVESVVWVIGRKDVLATLFYLASVLTYIRFMEDRRPWRYIFALALFVLGLLCKSILITLPVALLIWHWWKQGRVTSADITRVMPFFLLGLAITIADLSFYKGRDTTAFDYSLLERALLSAHALGFYAGKLVWPTELAVIYPRWEVSVGDWLGWVSATGAGAVLALLWFARHRIGRGPLAGALFFAVTLSPSLGFVDYGYMLYAFVADRYQYLAGIGVIAILAAAGIQACRWSTGLLPDARVARIVVPLWSAAAAALLVVLGTITWHQAGIYRDNFTFYSHVISMNPTARYVHHSLGQEYHKQERYEEALAAYRTDFRLAPEQPSPRIRISKNHSSMGRTLDALGRTDEAEEHYRRAVQLTPQFVPALDDLGAFLIGHKRYKESLRLFQTLIGMAPGQARYRVGYGVSLVGLGRYDEALRSYDLALALNPNLAMARNNRESLLKSMKSKKGEN